MMRATTLHQPWASLVAEGIKTIETRGHPAPSTIIGERIAIAAAQTLPGYARDFLRPPPGIGHDPSDGAVVRRMLWEHGYRISFDRRRLRHNLPLGMIVCTAVVVESCEMYLAPDGWSAGNLSIDVQSGWRNPTGEPHIAGQLPFGHYSPGRHAWLLADIEKIDPVPCKGKQGIWFWDPEVAA